MKYFTKEWYNNTVVAEMCFQLRKSGKAAVFSEKYFEKLYSVEKKAYLRFAKRLAKVERRKFDEAEASLAFDTNYKDNLEFVGKNLPREIIDDVADIRILALGTVTYDMADRIVRFCGQVNRKCESIDRNYTDSLEDIAEKLGWETVNRLDMLFNAPVSSVEDKDGTLTLRTSHVNTGVACKVTLCKAKIETMDENVLGSTVLRHELVELSDSDKKYCFSLLCSDENGKLGEMSIASDTVDIEEVFD